MNQVEKEQSINMLNYYKSVLKEEIKKKVVDFNLVKSYKQKIRYILRQIN